MNYYDRNTEAVLSPGYVRAFYGKATPEKLASYGVIEYVTNSLYENDDYLPGPVVLSRLKAERTYVANTVDLKEELSELRTVTSELLQRIKTYEEQGK